jgi:hypothetical protein
MALDWSYPKEIHWILDCAGLGLPKGLGAVEVGRSLS